jgi:hypothetical protein
MAGCNVLKCVNQSAASNGLVKMMPSTSNSKLLVSEEQELVSLFFNDKTVIILKRVKLVMPIILLFSRD